MTLRVSRAGLRVTVPPGTREAEVEAFLRESEGWIARRRERIGPPSAPLADGDRLALLNERLELAVRPGAEPPAARREGGRLVATAGPEGVDGAVERWYRREAAVVLGARSRALAARLGATVAAVGIRDPRSRWGSCSSAARLSFSWRLLLAPEEVLDYVVAHEVCHLVRPDHSPAFWALVEAAAPGHRGPRAWLREHGERLHAGPAWPSRLPGG